MVNPDTSDAVLSLVATVVFLTITTLAVSRGRRDPLAWQVAVLCGDLFVYDIAEVAKSHGRAPLLGGPSHAHVWDCVDNASASLAPVLFYHFVVAFVGQRHACRRTVRAAYVYFGVLAALSLSPLVVGIVSDRAAAWGNAFEGGASWAIAMLVAFAPVLAHGCVLLTRHYRGAYPEERARTRLVIATVFIAAIANAIDLVFLTQSQSTPNFGSWGLVISATVLASAAFRIRLFEKLSFLTAVNAGVIAIAVVLVEVAVFRYVGDRAAVAGACTVVVALAALLAARFVFTEYASARERTQAHATLGRMASQMASDIKRPLASMREAGQFLADERQAGRSIDTQEATLHALVTHCDLITRVVDRYQRIGQAKPVLGKTDINAATRQALALVTNVDSKLDAELPTCETDRDLLVIAIESIIRSAQTAARGRVRVETGIVSDDSAWVYIAIRDEGDAFDSPDGAFGLAFVRRVVDAHKGKLVVDSRAGAGTTVRIELRAS